MTTPHTHGGTDAPECTPEGIRCKPVFPDSWIPHAETLRIVNEAGSATNKDDLFRAIQDGLERVWAEGYEAGADSHPAFMGGPKSNPYTVRIPTKNGGES